VGCRSFAILCVDPDVPAEADDVNREGVEIAAGAARIEFFHWVLVDLPRSVRAIADGEFSAAVTARGKPGPAAPRGARQGINDYSLWFLADAAMSGDYHGYDGPCPPWNDPVSHRYVFTLHAIDVERLPLMGRFGGVDARKVIERHSLGSASLTGTYSLYTDSRGTARSGH
jgi:Raf kinase inhibitor-like YbhB/YbcL family protein